MVTRALIVLLLVATPTVVVADDAAVATAEREFQAGFRALERGDCRTALVHYQRSYELAPRPRTLFNMAVCHEELGEPGRAWTAYQGFLDQAEPRDAAIVARARTRLDVLRTRVRGRAFIDSVPSGASVFLDGERQPRGTTPLGLVLEPGRHQVRLSTRGAPALERTLEIVPDGVATLTVELAAPSTITIEVEPPDATIVPDTGAAPSQGRFHAEVATGPHTFVIRRAGHVTRRLSIDAAPGREHVERVVLPPGAAPGVVRVATDPRATVTLDRDPMHLGMREVDEGRHELRVEQPGRQPYQGRIDVLAGEELELTVQLPPRRSRALAWGMTGVGGGALIAGGVLGVLALRDVGSEDLGDHDRGKTRALIADGLFVAGAAALFVAWRASRPATPEVAVTRRRRAP